MTPSRLLIYEPLPGGHRPDFVRYLAEELRRSPQEGRIRFVLGPGFFDSEPELKALLSQLAPAVEVVEAPEPATHPVALQKAISDFHPDCTLLFELTRWENFLCRHRLPCDLAGILFVQYPEIEWRKGRGMERGIRFARRLVKEFKTSLWLRRQSVRAVFLLQGERAADWLNARFPDHPVFRPLPDPAPPAEPIVRECGRPARTGMEAEENKETALAPREPVRFLFPGVLSGRKGLFRLISALYQITSETAARAEFRFVGKVASGDRESLNHAMSKLWIRRPEVRAFIEDGSVSESEFRAAMGRADWILMPYLRAEYSSGILARAAAAGTPVIGPADGLLGRLIRTHGLGRAVEISPSTLALALDEAVTHPMRLDETNRTAFLEQSRSDEFAQRLLEVGRGGRKDEC